MGMISYKTLARSWHLDPSSPTVMTETWPCGTVRWESWVDVFSPMGREHRSHIGCVGMERLLVLVPEGLEEKSSLWLSLTSSFKG